MEHYDVIIIGGGPAGIVTGLTGIAQNHGKSFLMFKKEEKGLVPCGIPYIFHKVGSVEKNAMGPKPFVDAGGKVIVDTITNIDAERSIVTTKTGGKFQYEKLVFATGSTPLIPTFIPGHDLGGVTYIKKSYDYIKQLKESVDTITDIVVVGGGFIGVEVAEQLAQELGKVVSLVEREEYCLSKAFSKDSCQQAEIDIKKSGINIITSTSVSQVLGEDNRVSSVLLSNGETIPAQMVIMAIGYIPQIDLAQQIGLTINKVGAITVDNYQRTNKKNIFAVGDCAGKVGFITGNVDNIMLASTATAEARTLGYNLYTVRLHKKMIGTISVFSTEINGHAFASAGAIEQIAEEANIQYIVGRFKDVDRHPSVFEDTHDLRVKLIVSPIDGVIIGGEICGGKSVGELINVISLAIQKSVSVYELVSFQLGTHPLLTGAPTKPVLVKSAENAIAQIKALALT